MALNLKPYIERPIDSERIQAVQVTAENQEEITYFMEGFGYRVFVSDWLVVHDNGKRAIWTNYAFLGKFKPITDELATDRDRINAAVQLILECGMIDGSHHKQWVLDQVLRKLAGDDYKRIMDDYNSDEEYSDWDEGIAP